MPIDVVLWLARVGIFSAFKFQTQVKSNMKNPLLFLKIFLFFINYIYARLIYLISFSTFCFLINILQLLDVEILLLLYIKILLYFSGDIEVNPGPERSPLIFVCRISMVLLLMNLLKFRYYRGILQNAILTYVYLKPSLILFLTVKMIG